MNKLTSITFKDLSFDPKDYDLRSPAQTAALTVIALHIYGNDPVLGIELLNGLKGPQPLSEYEKQFLVDRFRDKKYVPISYFNGATPDNNYSPSLPYTIDIYETPDSYKDENYALLHLISGGADSPRQVKLRRKGEQWFLWEQFLLSDIRIPKADDPWA